MSAKVIMKRKGLFPRLEKPFDLPVYAEQIATAFVDFSCSKPKRRKDMYALNVLQFIDGSASKGRESFDSLKTSDFATKSTPS